MSFKQKNQCVMCRTKYPSSEKEAVEQLRPWVEKGKAWAQYMLGCRYRDGEGVDQSYQHAKELFELSASQGFTTAQYNLGVMYDHGQGVEQSDERAAEYYEAAARQGDADAQYNLGNRYYHGQGVEQSYETAREWWMKSAEQGNENAINNLQVLDKYEGRTTPSFIPKPFECASCYRPHDPPEHKLRPCKRCHRAFYCGKECQVKHWKRERNGHKKRCNKKATK
jgi:TPR repeat protein